jgi:pimeloyl-ACP methyl ester carboxylesterase
LPGFVGGERVRESTMTEHRMVETNGIRLHVAEMGKGPAVVFCHGWPETSYSWRHQLPALAQAGFRALAPDMRGYGRSDAPEPIEAYTLLHLVGDMVGLLEALEIDQAVIVGHDWGAPVAWNAALMRPDRFRAVVGMSVPYSPRGKVSLIDVLKKGGLTDFYMMYFQEPGVAEREFERDVTTALRRMLYSASGNLPEGTYWKAFRAPGGGLTDSMFDTKMPLPWLSEQDLAEYAESFRRSGFRGGFNWYRNIHRNWELLAPFAHALIRQPSMFLAGERDGVLRMPAMKSAVDNIGQLMPAVRKCEIIPGAGHWVQQEAPEKVNALLIEFLRGLA